MKIISVSAANRRFSALLRAVQEGNSVTIISCGRPVAVMEPGREGRSAGREQARRALLQRLQGQTAAGARDWTRDALYDD
ncbi:type II toxin-antitoxin system Phd/YefM family antitoxin [Algiphilus sp.]|uniref:type II toxin-antitoxin system Phd/YefM family antitoxin n=1 Tax=Algiphilus sp. TaxID=1872431 RepID=UPI003B5240CC